jgi:hypothetical protein
MFIAAKIQSQQPAASCQKSQLPKAKKKPSQF